MFGRSCFIVVFPFFGVLASLLLSLIVVLGSIRTNVLTNVYFLRVDISNLTVSSAMDLLTGSSSSSTAASSTLESALNTLLNSANPFPDFYTTALWNYCYGSVNSSAKATSGIDSVVNLGGNFEVEYCATPRAMYWFNVTDVLIETNGSGSNNTFVTTTVANVIEAAVESADSLQDVRDYISIQRGVSKATFVIYIVALVFLFLTLCVGCFACSSRGVSCCATILSVISFLLVLVAAGLATGMHTILRNLINDHLGVYGVRANMSSTQLGLAWGAVVAALWGSFWWFFAICCGSTARKSREPEKEPFIPYNNYPPQHPY